MSPPAGMDYDLTVCLDPANPGTCHASSTAGSAVETLIVYVDGTCGIDDSRYIYIKVNPGLANAASSVGYQLFVYIN